MEREEDRKGVMEVAREEDLDLLLKELRTLYQANPSKAGTLVGLYLKERLSDLAPEERAKIIEALLRKMGIDLSPPAREEGAGATGGPAGSPGPERELLAEILAQITGGAADAEGVSSQELASKIKEALATLIANINEIMAVINSTLAGSQGELATIRHIIGQNIQGEGIGLESYLGRIKEAFLIAHQAMVEASRREAEKILEGLDPEGLEKQSEGGLMFGPLKKAELFDAYKDQYQQVKQWLERGGYQQELLQEFERRCERLFGQR